MSLSSQEALFSEILEEDNAEWRDNSVDDLQAVVYVPVKEVRAEGEQNGGRSTYVMFEGGVARFKNHLLSSYKMNWSGVNGVTTSGEEFSAKIMTNPDVEGLQIDYLGPVSGENRFVAYRNERDEDYNVKGRWFYELDESFRKLRETYVDVPMANDLTALMGDGDGNVHLTYHGAGNDKYKYLILSKDGEVLFETLGYFAGLCSYGEGRVAVWEEIISENVVEEIRLFAYDLTGGKREEIGAFRPATIRKETNGNEAMPLPICITPISDQEFAWCGQEGLYFCNARGEETRMVYCWANHGMTMPSVSRIHGILARKDGSVALLYHDGSALNYLLLQPTPEKKELATITLATVSYNRDAFVSAATLFNKKYSDCRIEIRDDYDETSLLTQLGAGTGPVLVDTALIGFEELEKLWQPLDDFLAGTGLADELYPQAFEFGKIGDKTCAVATSFIIRALATGDPGRTDWDYDAFLACVEAFDGPTFTGQTYEGNTDARENFFGILTRGLEDNAYFDAQKDENLFGTPAFERILRLSEKSRNCPRAEAGKTLKNGEAMCEFLTVSGPQGLINLRVRKESGEGVLGLPTKNGARYLLLTTRRIALRSTATQEEKKIAYLFLRFLLSREYAEASVKLTTYAPFSVRKDVLEEQFDYYESITSDDVPMTQNDAPKLEREKDRALFEEILQNSMIDKSFPTGLQQVFNQEVGDYLAGRINGETLGEHLRSRTHLYLEEQK
ncbi:MAG: ABC transporter substrate-binding protein [Acetatifactor sp.]|nr:ABC transporter substrate-binding protein [Acetatifactor sp.]